MVSDLNKHAFDHSDVAVKRTVQGATGKPLAPKSFQALVSIVRT
jgi:hypothetical protein